MVDVLFCAAWKEWVDEVRKQVRVDVTTTHWEHQLHSYIHDFQLRVDGVNRSLIK